MRLISITAVAVAALLLTGCTKDDPSARKCPVQFTYSVHNQTAGGTRAFVDAFADGHEIGIYMVPTGQAFAHTDAVHNSLYSYSGSTFTGLSPLYWPEDASAVDFVAYFPHNPSVAAPDHTYRADIAAQTDFLASEKVSNKTSADGTVAFTFHHKMAKVVFIVEDEDTAADLVGVKTELVGVKTTADYGIEGLIEGFVPLSTTGTLTIAAPKEAADNSATVEALIFPGEATTYNIAFTLADGTTTIPESITEDYEADKVYTYTVNISQGGERVAVEVSNPSIHPWETGTPDIGIITVDKTTGAPAPTIQPGDLVIPAGLDAFDAGGGTFAIGYAITNPVDGETVSAVPSDLSWITVNPGTRAANSSVSITVAANTDTEPRSGSIELMYAGKTLASVAITQAGKSDSNDGTVTWSIDGTNLTNYSANSNGTQYGDCDGNHSAVASDDTTIDFAVTNVVIGNGDYPNSLRFGPNSNLHNTTDMGKIVSIVISAVNGVTVSECDSAGNAITTVTTTVTGTNDVYTFSGNTGFFKIARNSASGSTYVTKLIVTYEK